MKLSFISTTLITCGLFSLAVHAQTTAVTASPAKSKSAGHAATTKYLYLDVHHIGAGKVTFDAVAGAHQKDLATEKKYGTDFQKYWVDEAAGNVYCLVASPNEEAIRKTHAEAHGLMPDQIQLVTGGDDAPLIAHKNLYLDVHEIGAGKVSAKDVAGAHLKDLATQKKYGANFVNYWVNEKDGVVVCLVQASDTSAIIKTHKEAHGLIPSQIVKVRQGE